MAEQLTGGWIDALAVVNAGSVTSWPSRRIRMPSVHINDESPAKPLRVTLIGSRYFGAAVLAVLQREEVDIARVVVPVADDRLAAAAHTAGIEVVVLDTPKLVSADAVAKGTDLIIAAHSHARVSSEALARATMGGIGFHPSLLPRHRGIAAVEWTIRSGDPIAGGSIYHLAERMDAGAIAAQDWCFVRPGETARELWERALAPMGLALMAQVVRHARKHRTLPAKPQDEQFATTAPLFTDSAPAAAQRSWPPRG